ncbi:MAG TPA: acyl-CoA dehydrogenase, partial [Actinomycetales bacterium]|nr:acyl-CoA dehydrogenase [Actinomycetales bacterium]
ETEGGTAAGGELADLAGALRARVDRLVEVTGLLVGLGASDPVAMLANATAYLEATGHVVIAWMWLEQLLALGGRTADPSDTFAAGKLQAARYFLRWELPSVDAQLDLLASGDRTTLDMDPDWF